MYTRAERDSLGWRPPDLAGPGAERANNQISDTTHRTSPLDALTAATTVCPFWGTFKKMLRDSTRRPELCLINAYAAVLALSATGLLLALVSSARGLGPSPFSVAALALLAIWAERQSV